MIYFILLQKVFLEQHKPLPVFTAWELCHYTGTKPRRSVFTLDNHTRTDRELIQLCRVVKGNVVAREEALALVFKTDFVLLSTMLCKNNKENRTC